MKILGIETSCDETALAIIETRENEGVLELRVVDSLVHSQAELHSAYGGVYPNLAKREHNKNLPILASKLLGQDYLYNKIQIDRIAVTEGPGLEPALWTGITFAKNLSEAWKVPIIAINHMEGHIVGSLLKDDRFGGEWQKLKDFETPAVALLISGGHTQLLKVDNNYSHCPIVGSPTSIIGETKDDAVGEAFDKVARLLGLPYPGGPHISLLAEESRAKKLPSPIKLPRPIINDGTLNFSFSGLKTAVLYAVQKAAAAHNLNDDFKKSLAREFEDSVADVLDTKLRKAIEQIGAKAIIIGGGVSANHSLRQRFQNTAKEYSLPIFLPSRHISGDNALMIAIAGAIHSQEFSTDPHAQGTKSF